MTDCPIDSSDILWSELPTLSLCGRVVSPPEMQYYNQKSTVCINVKLADTHKKPDYVDKMQITLQPNKFDMNSGFRLQILYMSIQGHLL